jgi:hypothetical protein
MCLIWNILLYDMAYNLANIGERMSLMLTRFFNMDLAYFLQRNIPFGRIAGWLCQKWFLQAMNEAYVKQFVCRDWK